MQEKTCTKCGESKVLDEFHKDTARKDGRKCQCKICASTYNKSNKEYRRNYMKDYRKSDKHKKYYIDNKERILETNRQYRNDNHDKIMKQKKEYEQHKLKTNPNYRIAKNIRGRIRQLVHGANKSLSTMELLGCSIDILKEHLQTSAIANGYLDFNINEYSTTEYHIDHIMPCASFDLTDEEQQKECFHYTNLQILTAIENLIKSDKVGE